MKNLFISMVIFSLILVGCTPQTETVPPKDSNFHMLNSILMEHYSNQIRTLGLVNAYMNGVIQLKENPEKQKFYLGQLSTAREQLITLLTLDTISIERKEGGMDFYQNQLAVTMFKISDFGGKLSDWANKQSKITDIDYQGIQDILTISKEVVFELEQLLKNNQQNIIQINYNTDELTSKIDRMIELLTENN